MICELCGERFDPKYLSQVFKHEHKDELSITGEYLGERVDRCEHCGCTSDEGACFYCKMD